VERYTPGFGASRNVLDGADWRGARQNRLLTLSQGVGRRVWLVREYEVRRSTVR
jgi:hypothetical protein